MIKIKYKLNFLFAIIINKSIKIGDHGYKISEVVYKGELFNYEHRGIYKAFS